MWTLVIITITFLIHRFILKPMRHWRTEGINYVPGSPILGNFKDQVFKKKSIAEIAVDLYKALPNERYVGIFMFNTPALMIRDIELLKLVAVKDFDHFVNHRGANTEDYDPLMGKNLFFLKDNRWREMRAALSPAFTSSKMRGMLGLMGECASGFVGHLVRMDKAIMVMEMKELFTRYTNDVIASCAFGHRCNSLEERENEFYTMCKKATTFNGIQKLKFFLFQVSPAILKLFKIPLTNATVAAFFHKIVNESINYREHHHLIRPDIIHLLMEARKHKTSQHESNNTVQDTGFATVEESHVGTAKSTLHLTNDDITAQAFIFFFAGFETTSTLLSFLAHELAVNAHVQERLYEEVRTRNGVFTYDAIAQMTYLDMVTSECLRKWSPGFQTDRICSKDYLIPGKVAGERGYLIKQGTMVVFPIAGLHYDPQFFPDPQKFDPERFNDENKRGIVAGSYNPFGIGPRNCIGSRFALLEVKILLCHLMDAFRFEVVERTRVPIKLDVENFNLAMDGGCWLGLKLR